MIVWATSITTVLKYTSLVSERSYILNVIPLKLVARCEMREAVSQEVTGFPSFTSGVVGRHLSGALMVCARQQWRERPHPRLEAPLV